MDSTGSELSGKNRIRPERIGRRGAESHVWCGAVIIGLECTVEDRLDRIGEPQNGEGVADWWGAAGTVRSRS